MLEQQFNEEDYLEFQEFQTKMKSGINDEDLKVIYRLHSKYFSHNYIEPCGCGGAKKMDTINKWMGDLEKIFENGLETKSI